MRLLSDEFHNQQPSQTPSSPSQGVPVLPPGGVGVTALRQTGGSSAGGVALKEGD